MNKYSYKNIIIDPTKEGIESLIGKDVYFDDQPYVCLENANKDYNIGILEKIFKDSMYPFQVKTSEGEIRVFACIIVKKEPCYEDQVKQWIEENNLKVGDYVKVLRKTEPFENKWGSFWVDEMSDYIGKALKVLAINSLIGLISLECDDAVYDFPYFVLEKTEPTKPKYVPFESKEEFVRRYTEVKEGADFDTFEDNLFQCGMWLRCKENGGLFQVVGFLNDAVYLNIRAFDTNYQRMLNDFEFLDGSPCGKEVKDE